MKINGTCEYLSQLPVIVVTEALHASVVDESARVIAACGHLYGCCHIGTQVYGRESITHLIGLIAAGSGVALAQLPFGVISETLFYFRGGKGWEGGRGRIVSSMVMQLGR